MSCVPGALTWPLQAWNDLDSWAPGTIGDTKGHVYGSAIREETDRQATDQGMGNPEEAGRSRGGHPSWGWKTRLGMDSGLPPSKEQHACNTAEELSMREVRRLREEGSAWVWTPRGPEGDKYSHECPA